MSQQHRIPFLPLRAMKPRSALSGCVKVAGILGAIASMSLTGCAAQNNVPTAQDSAAQNPTTQNPTATDTTTAVTKTTVQSEGADADVNTDYRMTTVLEGLDRPWGIAWLPNGDMLITERPGRLLLARSGSLEPSSISGIPNDIFNENQGGLLDIALHPQFEENRLVYFTYSHGTNSANRTRVARAAFNGSALSEWEVVFEVSQTKKRGQHFGSRLAWLPDTTLLVSIGDGGNPPLSMEGELIRQQAQNIDSHLGKVIRIHDDGSVPSDNPFVDATDAEPEVWSYGHRNIQGLAFDSTRNQVWATEHGSRGGDEVNQVVGGENYGWPVATFSREYSGGLISPEQSLPGMVDPALVWTPSIAPSGLVIYSGDRFPELQGNLLAGGLVSADVRRIELDDSDNVINEESIPVGQRVRAVTQGPDGFVYVLTDEDNGQLIRLEPANS